MEKVAADQRHSWVDSVRPYLEREPLAALALGISSGFPITMIGCHGICAHLPRL
jgi:PAT family beta-lactamase induction signal transducer AmpG